VTDWSYRDLLEAAYMGKYFGMRFQDFETSDEDRGFATYFES
jgi:hypothetical protein